MSAKMDFVTALAHELRSIQGETIALFPELVQELLIRAAQFIEGQPVSDIKLAYEVEPEDLLIFTVLTIGEESSLLLPVDVATLRALLLTWDEQRAPQVGDTLTIPTRLPSGVITSIVTQELLDLAAKDSDETRTCKNCGNEIRYSQHSGWWHVDEREPGYWGSDGFWVICGNPEPKDGER